MTGQIPKYGKHFRLERMAYSATLSSSAYASKDFPGLYIRSDKTSKKWWIFFGSAEQIPVTFPSLSKAMSFVIEYGKWWA